MARVADEFAGQLQDELHEATCLVLGAEHGVFFAEPYCVWEGYEADHTQYLNAEGRIHRLARDGEEPINGAGDVLAFLSTDELDTIIDKLVDHFGAVAKNHGLSPYWRIQHERFTDEQGSYVKVKIPVL